MIKLETVGETVYPTISPATSKY